MEFEEVLKSTGGFGSFNKTVMMAVLVLATFRTSLAYLGHLFVLVTPSSQWCFAEDSFSGLPETTSLPKGKCQMMLPSNDGYGSNASFVREDVRECPTGWVFDSDEFFTTITMENQWLCSESWKMYAVHTSFWVGSMLGYLLSALLADRIGRKKTLQILIVICSSASLAGTLLTDLVGFTVLRCLAGMGAYTVCSTVYVLVVEYTVSRKRTFIAFTWASTWTVIGSLYPWYAYFLQSWRGLLVTNGCVDLLLLLTLCWVPESSSWLMSAGRTKEALDTLEKVARLNGSATTRRELQVLLSDSICGKVGSSSGVKKLQSFSETTVAIWKMPRIRKFTLLIYAAWFAISLCYNGGTLELGRLGLNIYSTYSTAIAFELPVNVLCILTLDNLGRRWPNVAFMLLGGVACLVVALVRTDSELAVLVMAVVSIMSFSGGYTVTYQLAGELFPTVIRGRAILIQRFIGDVGGLLGTRVASLAESDKYIPMLVMGVVALTASFILFFLPDTVNEALPQTLEDGDNVGRGQGLCFCPVFASKPASPKKRPEVEAYVTTTRETNTVFTKKVNTSVAI
ncbi:solute carrier family 22 member 8 [Ixodes scapularis]